MSTTASIAVLDIIAEDADTFAATTVSGSTVTGGDIYFFTKYPSMTLVSQSATPVAATSGSSTLAMTAVIKLNITANGGDIYIRHADTTAASSGIVGESSIQNTASCTEVYVISTNADNKAATANYFIPSGETKWFEISNLLSNVDGETAGAADGYYVHGIITLMHWVGADDAADGYEQNWGFDDFKTSDVFLYDNTS